MKITIRKIRNVNLFSVRIKTGSRSVELPSQPTRELAAHAARIWIYGAKNRHWRNLVQENWEP